MAAVAAAEGGRRLGRAGLLCFCVWEKSAREQLLNGGRLGAPSFAQLSTFLLAGAKKALPSAFLSLDTESLTAFRTTFLVFTHNLPR